jgi:hypothetical protein
VQDFVAQDAPMRLSEYAKQYGGLYRIRFFYAFGVIATDPTLVRAVLQVGVTAVTAAGWGILQMGHAFGVNHICQLYSAARVASVWSLG